MVVKEGLEKLEILGDSKIKLGFCNNSTVLLKKERMLGLDIDCFWQKSEKMMAWNLKIWFIA